MVTTSADVVNGDVSSIEALLSAPGPDGASLREAVIAVNNTPGLHSIRFSALVADQVISLQGQALVIMTGIREAGGVLVRAGPAPLYDPSGRERLHVTDVRIEGNVFDNAGVTFSQGIAVRFQTNPGSSGASISRLRIARNTFSYFTTDTAVLIHTAGADGFLSDVAVEANEFSDGLYGLEFGNNGNRNRTVGVRIERNTFMRNSQGVVPINNNGSQNVLDHTLITGNLISDSTSAGVGIGGGLDCADCVIRNVWIIGNTIVTSDFRGTGIDISGGDTFRGGELTTRRTVVSDTVIEANVIIGGDNPITILGGGGGTDNVVRNTTIINNLVVAGVSSIRLLRLYPSAPAAIYVSGGHLEATGNRVDGVTVMNNTLVSHAYGLLVESNIGAAVGNSVAGVTVTNTIIRAAVADVQGEIGRDQVSFCLLNQSDFAGVNGNVGGDPHFADPSAGDFRLRAGSPAIDAGTSLGAPATDLNGRWRFDDPATPNTGDGPLPFVDLGAFEFRAPVRRRAVRH